MEFSKQAPMCLASKLILSKSTYKNRLKLLFKPRPFILYIQFSIKHTFSLNNQKQLTKSEPSYAYKRYACVKSSMVYSNGILPLKFYNLIF